MSAPTVLNCPQKEPQKVRAIHLPGVGNASDLLVEKPLLTRWDVASLFGFKSTKSIWRYERLGLLKAVHINSRVVRYRNEDVRAFLNSSTV